MILHAHEPPVVYGELAFYVPEEKVKELQRKYGEDILRPSIETAKRAGVTFTSQVLMGDIPQSIVSCAETLGCDGIVMGTRRHERNRQSGRGVCCNEGYSPHQTSGHARKVALKDLGGGRTSTALCQRLLMALSGPNHASMRCPLMTQSGHSGDRR